MAFGMGTAAAVTARFLRRVLRVRVGLKKLRFGGVGIAAGCPFDEPLESVVFEIDEDFILCRLRWIKG
jgi:hypothetical protein